jgi:hypothetical protein
MSPLFFFISSCECFRAEMTGDLRHVPLGRSSSSEQNWLATRKKYSLSKKTCGVPFVAPHGVRFSESRLGVAMERQVVIPVYPEQAYGNRRKP